jgi:sugar-specific transcriptional regulator TrmB
MHKPHQLLERLGLTASERIVYLALLKGAEDVASLKRITKQKTPTIYYAISRLQERGLLRRTGKLEGARFAVEQPSRLQTIASELIQEAKDVKNDVDAFVLDIAASQRTKGEKPQVSFYEGVDVVKTVVMETLYTKTKKIDTITPINNFMWQIGQRFTDSYTEERIRRGIKKRNLWDQPIDPVRFRRYYHGRSDARILPAHMKEMFKSSVFIYDDKTLYVSSMENCYALLVTSAEHAATMQAMFEGLWQISHTHPLK